MILYPPKKRENKTIKIQGKQLENVFVKYGLYNINKETSLKDYYEQYTKNDRKCIS